MRENADQNNSEYYQFIRSAYRNIQRRMEFFQRRI